MGTAIVIDDSRAMRSMMSRIVTQLGFDCLQAEDGQAALEALDDHGAVTVALVDWNMPRLNGLEFVRAVRADRRYDGMQLLMVTSEASPRNVYEAIRAGADEYAMKPVTKESLVEKLRLIGITPPAEAEATPTPAGVGQ